jgi:hypothetical protein
MKKEQSIERKNNVPEAMRRAPHTKPAKKPAKRKNLSAKIKAKKSNYLKFADVPRDFMEETGYTLADYSVALGFSVNENATKFEIYASGVLVRKGNRFGILTAHHCVHKPAPEFRFGSFDGDKLLLVLKRNNFIVLPPEILVKHALAIPKANKEPDLAFVEILPSPQLGSIKAIGSFWSLDKNPLDIEQEFGKINMPFTVVGFPGAYHQTKIEGKTTRKIIKHMAYFYAIGSDGICERDGWDYIEANNWYGGNNELPKSFVGVSGGPVWGLQIKRDEKNGQLSLKKFALIGIAFLEIPITKKKLRVRAHFIKSIYELAWRTLD